MDGSGWQYLEDADRMAERHEKQLQQSKDKLIQEIEQHILICTCAQTKQFLRHLTNKIQAL